MVFLNIFKEAKQDILCANLLAMSEKLKAHGLEPDDESTAGTMPKKNMLSFLNYPGTKNLKFHNPDVSSGLLHSGFGAGQSLTSQVL